MTAPGSLPELNDRVDGLVAEGRRSEALELALWGHSLAERVPAGYALWIETLRHGAGDLAGTLARIVHELPDAWG